MLFIIKQFYFYFVSLILDVIYEFARAMFIPCNKVDQKSTTIYSEVGYAWTQIEMFSFSTHN